MNKYVGGSMENHYNWKGGKTVDLRGYVHIKTPNHPRINSRGYVREHILIAEKALGRHLRGNEVVHHINEDKQDNQSKNLLICDRTHHHYFHYLIRKERGEVPLYRTREWLIKKYWNDKLSLEQIAKIANVTSPTVRGAMVFLNIPRRDLLTARRVRFQVVEKEGEK